MTPVESRSLQRNRNRTLGQAPRNVRGLTRALGVGRAGVHAFVGAGGKTAAIRQLLIENPRALATTTTHLGSSGFGIGLLGVAPDVETLLRIESHLLETPPVTLALGSNGLQVGSPSLEWHLGFATRHRKTTIFVEADGAAQHLAKLPGAHEPAWPPAPWGQVVIVANLEALGQSSREVLHRPDAFRKAGLRASIVGPEHFELMLQSYAAKAPPHSALRVLCTGVSSERMAISRRLATRLAAFVRARDPDRRDPGVPLRMVMTQGIDSGRFGVWDLGRGPSKPVPRLAGVCGVLLAAGQGIRFGTSSGVSKLLAPWRGRTLVEQAVRRWCAAGFADVVVVLGHAAREIEPLVERAAASQGVTVRIVRNREHAKGLGSSVRKAARSSPHDMAFLFGHADMPAVRPQTLRRVAEMGMTLGRYIVVPTRAGRPTNPAYFPSDLRRELAHVGDRTGGKPVYSAHPDRVFYLNLGDAPDLVDVDRPADLDRLART